MTKSNGKKFGKSEEGNIWMDGEMTSPYKFYQFWINADDADIPKFTRYFTLHTKEEIEARESEFADDPRALKKLLAEELTKRVHGNDSYESVLQVSEILFNKKASNEYLKGLSSEALQTISEEIMCAEVDKSVIENGINIIDLLSEQTSICASKSEARRALKGNAVSINKEKKTDDSLVINADDLIKGQYIMVENGKKNKLMVKVK